MGVISHIVVPSHSFLACNNKQPPLLLPIIFHSHCSNPFMFLPMKHVYIPLLFFSGVDYIGAPTPYMMGLHSGVDTSTLAMDGVSSCAKTFLGI